MFSPNRMERGVVRVVPVIEVSPISTPGHQERQYYRRVGFLVEEEREPPIPSRPQALANSYTKADHGSQEPRVKLAPMVEDDGAKLRRELRGAATAEELTRLIEKAAKAGYKADSGASRPPFERLPSVPYRHLIMSRRPQQGAASHALMLPPVGYKFIPKSKDRRIMELEMRNNDLCKNLTLLQGQLFAKIQQHRESGSAPVGGETVQSSQPTFRPGGPPSANMKDAFAYVQSPVLHDPVSNRNYVATTTYTSPP
ncbi:hypothetical protein FOZ60_010700 [Perkinsus olseni]|uniref:Uncharacterized protein n=1 Tax=Perkinsus olseni TaxID=32597 RepID=A0A7J6PDF7_PEROL|nr:hypothetical protein FOZ60_010700 [Perkinsus olseni]